MYEDLIGKVALVTGATKGIGRGIAEKLAALGVRLMLSYSADEAAATATRPTLTQIGADFVLLCSDAASPVAIAQLYKAALGHYGQLDIVVANAGIELIETPVLASTEADFDRVFSLNVKGTFFVLQQAARHLVDGGRLLLISSTMSIPPDVGAAIYAASKAATKSFIDVLAKELGPRQIAVNSVMPGIIDNAGVITAQPESVKQQMRAGSPFKRLGTPADVANVVAFLASGEGAFVHGHHLQVNGGSIY